jgi:hypothetical protein
VPRQVAMLRVEHTEEQLPQPMQQAGVAPREQDAGPRSDPAEAA